MDTFSRWLLDELNARGWSQAELARRAGVSRTAISDAVSGRRNVGSDLAKGIAKALGYSDTEVMRVAGIIENHTINDRSARLAYRISQLPAEDQETIDAMIDGLYNRRKNRGEIIDLPNHAAPGEA